MKRRRDGGRHSMCGAITEQMVHTSLHREVISMGGQHDP
jgi:hypothetical protein